MPFCNICLEFFQNFVYSLCSCRSVTIQAKELSILIFKFGVTMCIYDIQLIKLRNLFYLHQVISDSKSAIFGTMKKVTSLPNTTNRFFPQVYTNIMIIISVTVPRLQKLQILWNLIESRPFFIPLLKNTVNALKMFRCNLEHSKHQFYKDNIDTLNNTKKI